MFLKMHLYVSFSWVYAHWLIISLLLINFAAFYNLCAFYFMMRPYRYQMCSRYAGARWSLRKPEFRVNLGAQVLGTALNSLRFGLLECLLFTLVLSSSTTMNVYTNSCGTLPTVRRT